MGKKHKPKKNKLKSFEDGHEEGEEREKESLKIVLKVGVADQAADVSFHEEKKRKHKKKKKKKDREKSRQTESDFVKGEENNEDEDRNSLSQGEEGEALEPPAKKAAPDVDDGSNSSAFSQDTSCRNMQPLPNIKDDEKGILRESLLYVQKHLQRKDANGFFAYPVNDVIAPGYSSTIREPMDFSTMQTKIENNVYDTIMDYKNDYVLMCNNAMTYNRPETIYYKEAKRLLQSGLKMMSKEKLLSMKRSLGFMASITVEEIGLNQKDNTNAVLEEINAKEREYEITVKNRDMVGGCEAFPDNMTPGDIIAQTQASEAKGMETLKPVRNKLSFLRKREDGTTSLAIINPDDDGIVGENEKIISLGALVGKLTSGTGNIAGFREDKRNKANQINYLNYGPFSSHAPSYDTSFSNISKDESDLLLSTYGDEAGMQYSQSIMRFVEDAEEDYTRIVDSLLDVLTKGQHSTTLKHLQQKQVEGRPQAIQDESSLPQDVPASRDPVQNSLDKTAELLKDLQQTQYERLSLKPPPHLGNIIGPGDTEKQLAEKITSELTKLVKNTTPQNITSLRGIRKAMGIGLISIDEPQPIEIDQSETVCDQEMHINQAETFTQNMNDPNYIDNELLMAADGTVIDNL